VGGADSYYQVKLSPVRDDLSLPRKPNLLGPASEGLRPEITELLSCHEGPSYAANFLRENKTVQNIKNNEDEEILSFQIL
jgi:hypothetical protein